MHAIVSRWHYCTVGGMSSIVLLEEIITTAWCELRVKNWTLFSNETLIKKGSRESFSIFYITYSCFKKITSHV